MTDPKTIDFDALHRAAYDLSTYAATAVLCGDEPLTISYRRGLREKIEAVQAFGQPSGTRGIMSVDDAYLDSALRGSDDQ